MAAVSIRSVRKEFADAVAVDDVSLDVVDGEFLVLLGPSGCGKTTTLRSIAGLERPQSGEIVVGGTVIYSSQKDVFAPPNRRGLGMVFQSYAIWPHMTVIENVMFPLQVGRHPAPRARNRSRDRSGWPPTSFAMKSSNAATAR